MDWTEILRKTIDYIEANLLEKITAENIAANVNVSPFYLQKGFSLVTGYTIAEYIRYRRLYLSALDIIDGNEKIINIAFRYGYDSSESFSKAFSRFHGIPPVKLKQKKSGIRPFLPLKIKLIIQGGYDMDYLVEKIQGFRVIGFERKISFENSYEEIPKFWDEFCKMYIKNNNAETEQTKIVQESCVGEFGICIDDKGKEGEFRYIIGGKYDGEAVPDGMTIYEFPDMEWVKFSCTGPMPGALQTVNTKIFKEWLPGNPEYKIAMGVNIEWYSKGDTQAKDYKSEIWLPVERKKK